MTKTYGHSAVERLSLIAKQLPHGFVNGRSSADNETTS